MSRRPIEEVLPGASLEPLLDKTEDGAKLSFDAAFLLIRCKLPDGSATWSFRTTRPGLSNEELLGQLLIQFDLLKRSLLAEWEVD